MSPAAIQLLSNNGGNKSPTKVDTIQYIYTNSEHNNPIYRVVPLDLLQKGEKEKDSRERNTLNYDNEKYRDNSLCCINCPRLFWF